MKYYEASNKERRNIMNLYYCTFGIGTKLEHYYQTVLAKSKNQAENKMIEEWGRNFAFCYTEKQFADEKSKGRFQNLKELPALYATEIITVGEINWLTDRFENIIGGTGMFKKKRLEIMLSDVKEAYNDDPYAKVLTNAIKEAIEEVA